MGRGRGGRREGHMDRERWPIANLLSSVVLREASSDSIHLPWAMDFPSSFLSRSFSSPKEPSLSLYPFPHPHFRLQSPISLLPSFSLTQFPPPPFLDVTPSSLPISPSPLVPSDMESSPMPSNQPSFPHSRPPASPNQSEIQRYAPPRNVDLVGSSVTRPHQLPSSSPLNEAASDLELGLSSCSDEATLKESGMGPSSEAREPVMTEAQEARHLEEFLEDDDDDDGQCRVCHLVCEVELGTTETMRLGCHCKDELGIAHRNCAEAWFKIKGNRICEICGATAQNIVGNEDPNFMEQWNDANVNESTEPQARCWQSLSLCNFFLACMVVTFILLWLFRVTIS